MRALILESAFNSSPIDDYSMQGVSGKVVFFYRQGLSGFYCTNNPIFMLSVKVAGNNVGVKLDTLMFFDLIKGGNVAKLLKQNKLAAHKGVKTAQKGAGEEAAPKIAGDMLLHPLYGLFNALKNTNLIVKGIVLGAVKNTFFGPKNDTALPSKRRGFKSKSTGEARHAEPV